MPHQQISGLNSNSPLSRPFRRRPAPMACSWRIIQPRQLIAIAISSRLCSIGMRLLTVLALSSLSARAIYELAVYEPFDPLTFVNGDCCPSMPNPHGHGNSPICAGPNTLNSERLICRWDFCNALLWLWLCRVHIANGY
jgi:hypothetical protein